MASPSPTSGSDRRRGRTGATHAHVWEVATPLGPRVVKVAALARARREAAALAHLAGAGIAPRLVAVGDGVLVTERVGGRPLPAAAWSLTQATQLGRLLRRVHELPLPGVLAAELAGAPSREVRLAAIRRDCVPEARGMTEAAIGALAGASSLPPVLLHGDLWSGNVVWDDDVAVIVDWEYARPGEPAEDLAYLAALDELSDPTLDAILDGYGADAQVRASARAWRPLMAAWSGSWYTRRGDTDRGARLLAHAARLLVTCGPEG